jgi:hypothetical protein
LPVEQGFPRIAELAQRCPHCFHIASTLVFDAIAWHGNAAAAQNTPPGALNRIDQCLRAFEAADLLTGWQKSFARSGCCRRPFCTGTFIAS